MNLSERERRIRNRIAARRIAASSTPSYHLINAVPTGLLRWNGKVLQQQWMGSAGTQQLPSHLEGRIHLFEWRDVPHVEADASDQEECKVKKDSQTMSHEITDG